MIPFDSSCIAACHSQQPRAIPVAMTTLTKVRPLLFIPDQRQASSSKVPLRYQNWLQRLLAIYMRIRLVTLTEYPALSF